MLGSKFTSSAAPQRRHDTDSVLGDFGVVVVLLTRILRSEEVGGPRRLTGRLELEIHSKKGD